MLTLRPCARAWRRSSACLILRNSMSWQRLRRRRKREPSRARSVLELFTSRASDPNIIVFVCNMCLPFLFNTKVPWRHRRARAVRALSTSWIFGHGRFRVECQWPGRCFHGSCGAHLQERHTAGRSRTSINTRVGTPQSDVS